MEETNQAPASAVQPTSSEGPTAAEVGKVPISSDMHVKVYSPFHVYFDDKATSISGLNDTGPFDILPGHRNFMTLVSACELVIRTASGGEQKIKIARAVMHVKADEVRVFLDV
jgi:F0F1-type ATP synthase epsilon subunit